MNPDAATINTFLLSGGTAAAVFLILGLVKPYIETVLPPTARLHDPSLKLLALALGVIIEVVAHGLIAPLSSQRVFLDIGLGAMAGLSAMGIHILPKPTPGADTSGDLLPGLAALLSSVPPPVQRMEITHVVLPPNGTPASQIPAPPAHEPQPPNQGVLDFGGVGMQQAPTPAPLTSLPGSPPDKPEGGPLTPHG